MPDMINTKEAAKIAGCSVGHLRNIRKHKDAPDYIRVNPSLVMYDRIVFEGWAKERQRQKIAAIMGTSNA